MCKRPTTSIFGTHPYSAFRCPFFGSSSWEGKEISSISSSPWRYGLRRGGFQREPPLNILKGDVLHLFGFSPWEKDRDTGKCITVFIQIRKRGIIYLWEQDCVWPWKAVAHSPVEWSRVSICSTHVPDSYYQTKTCNINQTKIGYGIQTIEKIFDQKFELN